MTECKIPAVAGRDARSELHSHIEFALLRAVREAATRDERTRNDPDRARARDRYVRALNSFSRFVLHDDVSLGMPQNAFEPRDPSA